MFDSSQRQSQNELRKAALERAGGNTSRKVVLPGKGDDSDLRVVEFDKLTRTQVTHPRPSCCKIPSLALTSLPNELA